MAEFLFLSRNYVTCAQRIHPSELCGKIRAYKDILCAAYWAIRPHAAKRVGLPQLVCKSQSKKQIIHWITCSLKHFEFVLKVALAACDLHTLKRQTWHPCEIVLLAIDENKPPSSLFRHEYWDDPPQQIPMQFHTTDAVEGYREWYSSIARESGGSNGNPQHIKDSIKSAMNHYLFRRTSNCVAFFKFATHAHKILDFSPMKTQAQRDTILSLVESLEFETVYPNYYTNWEEAFQIVSTTSDTVYLITDGNPTVYKGSSIPSDDKTENVRRAQVAAKVLIDAKITVIPIGVGPHVSDANLVKMAGPCSWGSCLKGWNYFHVDSFKRMEEPLSGSIRARFLKEETLKTLARVSMRDAKDGSSHVVVDPDGVVAFSGSEGGLIEYSQDTARRALVNRIARGDDTLSYIPLEISPSVLAGVLIRQGEIETRKKCIKEWETCSATPSDRKCCGDMVCKPTGNGNKHVCTNWEPTTTAPRPTPAPTCDPQTRYLNFETRTDRTTLVAGDDASSAYSGWGVSISVRDGSIPTIFDSAAPTCGDSDLGTPNRAFGGPGVGGGGGSGQVGENSRPLGNVLIIQEGSSNCVPDDLAGGEHLIFDFEDPITLHWISILDSNRVQSITITQAGGITQSFAIQNLGGNSYQRVSIEESGVTRVVVEFSDSGAVAKVMYTQECPTSSPTAIPTTGTLTNAPTSSAPTSAPTTSAPTAVPTNEPTTSAPTAVPTNEPTTSAPTAVPTTSAPTAVPTNEPTTSAPTAVPTNAPTTSTPTAVPTNAPTTSAPTAAPTAVPTKNPTDAPTVPATQAPTETTVSPSPTVPATQAPTETTVSPSPTVPATQAPTETTVSPFPTVPATQAPTETTVSPSPTVPATQAPTETTVSPSPTVPATQAPTETTVSPSPTVPATQAPTETTVSPSPTVPATQAPTETTVSPSPTVPATQAPTETTVSPSPTVPATQAPTETTVSPSPTFEPCHTSEYCANMGGVCVDDTWCTKEVNIACDPSAPESHAPGCVCCPPEFLMTTTQQTTSEPTGAPTPLPTVDESTNAPTPSPTVDESTDAPTPSPTVDESTDAPTLSPTVDEGTGAPTPPPTVDESTDDPTPSPTVEEEGITTTAIIILALIGGIVVILSVVVCSAFGLLSSRRRRRRGSGEGVTSTGPVFVINDKIGTRTKNPKTPVQGLETPLRFRVSQGGHSVVNGDVNEVKSSRRSRNVEGLVPPQRKDIKYN